MVGETLFKWNNFTSDYDIGEFEEVGFVLFGSLSVGMMFVLLSRDDYFAGIEFAFGVFLVKCRGNFLL